MMRKVFLLLLALLLLSGCALRAPAPASTPEPTPESAPCPHPVWVDGRCSDCGEACAHPRWEEGACIRCGLSCAHAWTDGVCSVCALRCPHETHDSESLQCLVCGEGVWHDYLDGLCTVCGAAPLVYDHVLPEHYYEPCEQAGSIESWSYQNAVPGWAEYTRHLLIYLPYGYDPEGQYDVMILLHGTGDDETAWLTQEHYVPDRMMTPRTIYDHMIHERLMRPIILVTMRLYEDFGAYVGDPTEQRLAEELQTFVLPHLAEHYATYAASGAPEDLQAARGHFGLGGLSWGSYFSYAAGMRHSLPYFSNFICLSGNDGPDLVLSTINSPELIGYPIELYYSAAGTTDMAYRNGINNFRYLVDNTERLTEGKNAFLHECEGGHTWNVWTTEIFNALQLAFPHGKK